MAKAFLANFDASLATMVKVMPRDYKAVLQKRKAQEQQATLAAEAV